MTTSNNDKKIIKPLTSDPHQEIMITSSKIVATTKNAKEEYVIIFYCSQDHIL